MARIFVLPAILLGLAACAPSDVIQKARNMDAPVVSCDRYSGSGCSFDKAPLRVLPQPVTIAKRPYKFFPTAEQLNFVDARKVTWTAPSRTLTDGASIPLIFVSIVGDPTSEEFINAAAMHDAYCGIGNETGLMYHQAEWEDVHKMFYDGLVVGGAEGLTAKLMFAAVWLGGPRWETPRTLTHVPVSRQKQAMAQTKAYIEAENPTLEQLLRYLKRQESAMLSEYPKFRTSPPEESEVVEVDVYDPAGQL